MLLGNILAAVICFPFLFQETYTLADVGGIAFLGVLQLGIPFIMMSVAVRYLTAVETILIQTLEPILNPVWVFFIIGETPSTFALIGGIIVLVSVTLRGVLASPQTPNKVAQAS